MGNKAPVVFIGPTLAPDEAANVLDADYRPPVRQGDVLRAADADPPAIAIIDGIFTDAPTVRHREILWVMAKGIPVFGAASMGALRAAELHGHGMIGVGLIYRWYRRVAMAPDDAVAVAHAPLELGAIAVSDALIDIRMILKRAVRRGVMPPEEAENLMARAAAQRFADRDLRRLLQGSLHADRVMALAAKTDRQKAIDARALLSKLAEHARIGHWPAPTVAKPPVVHAWLDDLEASGFDGAAFRGGMCE